MSSLNDLRLTLAAPSTLQSSSSGARLMKPLEIQRLLSPACRARRAVSIMYSKYVVASE